MDKTTIVIGPGRFSYLNCFEAKSMGEGQEKKFSVSFIFSKKDKVLLKKMQAAIEAAKQLGAEKKWGGKIPAKLKLPIRDGDIDREDDPNYAKSWFITASSTIQPGVVNAAKEPIMDHNEIYSGVYGNLNVTFYPFDTAGNRGIGVSLNHVMMTKKGDRLSGGISVEDAFADIEVEDDEEVAGLL